MQDAFRSLATLCVCVLFATCAVAQTPAPVSQDPVAHRLERADLEAWLDGLVPYAIEQGDIAGFVVSVVKDGEVLLEKGYGYADVAARIPMDPERTTALVASVSKTFTATAVMQLVEQGKLDLNRDINSYLDFRIPDAFGKPITLRNLLTHTAGFAEMSYKRYVPPRSLREHVLMIPERIYPPGQVTAYSNYGLQLAGYIVGRISGQSITDYVEGHILQPLGMSRSTFHITFPAALEPFKAKTYSLASEPPYPPNLIAQLSPIDSPAGGLATTAHDMTRFMLAHLQQGRYGDFQLLRPETLALMHAPTFAPIAGTQPVALGLFRSDYRGHRVLGHSGDGEGAHADMRLLLDENVGLFTATNSDGFVQGIFPAAFMVRTRLFEKFMDRYYPRDSAPQEPTASTAQEHAEQAAGEYAWSRQSKGDYQEALALIVRFLALKPYVHANADGTIETPAVLTFEKNGRAQTWREVGPYVWREVGGDARLVMKVQDGQVQSLWTDQVFSFWVNLRVPYIWSASLNVPLLGLATAALMLTAVLWPVAAITRRRYGQTLQLVGLAARASLLTRLAAVLGSVYMLGWMIALAADFASIDGAEPWVRLLQVIGLLCVGGAGIAVWNAWLTWRGARSIWAKAWSSVLALALLYLAWFSFAFHLISIRLN